MPSMAEKHEHHKYDAAERRKSHRKGSERGVNIFIPAAMLRAAGIDPDGPCPEWQGWPRNDKGSSIIVKLYRPES
jgi:hypothetical protein